MDEERVDADSAHRLHRADSVHGNHDTLQCTAAFPYGLDLPVGVNTYFPADIASMDAAPLIVLTGGITSNPGNYDALARLFTSHGFVVSVPYDFFNSLPEMPALGPAAAIAQHRDANSPLFGKVDTTRSVRPLGHRSRQLDLAARPQRKYRRQRRLGPCVPTTWPASCSNRAAGATNSSSTPTTSATILLGVGPYASTACNILWCNGKPVPADVFRLLLDLSTQSANALGALGNTPR
ncbi:hypothetical protein [Nocardia sp. NPDC127526]|uniref:hypothetical protein n=1 Tax=Nocardia sp. NPDC127526 TaxID=3345393 RepID=UPI00364496F5